MVESCCVAKPRMAPHDFFLSVSAARNRDPGRVKEEQQQVVYANRQRLQRAKAKRLLNS
jgi:hypothetical protein